MRGAGAGSSAALLLGGRVCAQVRERRLQQVVTRRGGEHRGDGPARRRGRACAGPPGRARSRRRCSACTGAARRRRSAAGGPSGLRRRLVDERPPHPALDLLVDDELGQREAGGGERRQLGGRDRRAPARAHGGAGQQRAVEGRERGVVGGLGRGAVDRVHSDGPRIRVRRQRHRDPAWESAAAGRGPASGAGGLGSSLSPATHGGRLNANGAPGLGAPFTEEEGCDAPAGEWRASVRRDIPFISTVSSSRKPTRTQSRPKASKMSARGPAALALRRRTTGRRGVRAALLAAEAALRRSSACSLVLPAGVSSSEPMMPSEFWSAPGSPASETLLSGCVRDQEEDERPRSAGPGSLR